MSWLESIRPEAKAKRRLLALDGGGIRGVLTLEILAGIESMLRKELGRPELVLGDYFDAIGGTSTGAIIAAALARGMTVEALLEFYVGSGAAMFDKAGLLQRFRYKYEDEKLAEKLKDVFGATTTLGDPSLRTLLMMVLRNATTDSPWPLWNNPWAKYNDRTRPDCNLDLPLWQLVRASTAAPTYFPPQVVEFAGGKYAFVFVDGGVTMYNNPAFQLFLMTTVAPYRLGWPCGADRMLLVSVGTGTSPGANKNLAPGEMNLLYNAGSVPSALMFAALNEQDLLCRVFGRCRVGEPLDREVGDLQGVAAPGGSDLFTYIRLNAELSSTGLGELGVGDIPPENVQKLDSVEHTAELRRVGKAVVERRLEPAHFAGFLAD
jgi:Patatin-like phospholipase